MSQKRECQTCHHWVAPDPSPWCNVRRGRCHEKPPVIGTGPMCHSARCTWYPPTDPLDTCEDYACREASIANAEEET